MEGAQTSRGSSVLSSALSTEDENMVDAVPNDEPVAGKPLVEEVFAALTQEQKNQQGAGDVLIVLDVNDFIKSCRMRSDVLTAKSSVLRNLLNQPGFASSDKTYGVKYLLVLEKATDPSDTGFSVARKGLDFVLTDRQGAERSEDGAPALIKKEPGIIEENGRVHKPSAGWMTGYENVLRTLNGGIPSLDQKCASTALPDIEIMLAAAKQIGAIEPIVLKLDHILTKRYDRSRTLLPAIAENAARWLNIAMIMENEIIFEEAFTHLAGKFPDLSDDDRQIIPPGTLQRVVRASEALFQKRREAESALFCTTLEVPIKLPDNPDTDIKAPVSLSNAPLQFILLSMWQEWIREHVAHLHDGSGAEGNHETFACNHANKCLTVSGLYDVLHKGGDAYLELETVLSRLRSVRMLKIPDMSEIRPALAALKCRGSEIVKPLLKSNLRLPDSSVLEYLTCVDFENEDIPWNKRE